MPWSMTGCCLKFPCCELGDIPNHLTLPSQISGGVRICHNRGQALECHGNT